MIDETKLMLEDGENANLQDEQSMFSFQNLFAMLVLNWQWFLLSLIICLSADKGRRQSTSKFSKSDAGQHAGLRIYE